MIDFCILCEVSKVLFVIVYFIYIFFRLKKNSSNSDHLVIEVRYNVLTFLLALIISSDRDRNKDASRQPLYCSVPGQVGVSGRVFARNY